jgi:Esterase PHB depolymerase
MRNWRLSLVLLLLVIVPLARAADFPRFSAGQSDVVFHEAAPESSDRELKRRFDAKETPPAYDVAKEKFRVIVPGSYRRDAAGWGLFVWVDASPEPNLPADWASVLAEKRLICVSAYNSGNARNLFDRCRLAIDAVSNMKHRFHLDPKRVYVSGASGGGRVASMLGVAYGDVFSGAFPMIGVNFYKPVSTGEPNKAWLPIYEPDADILAKTKASNRYVLLTGEKDFNRENTQRVYKDGFQAEGFRHVLYLEVPELGHSRPSGEWLDRGIHFLDSDPVKHEPKQARPERDDAKAPS